jgi:hypothetical protein
MIYDATFKRFEMDDSGLAENNRSALVIMIKKSFEISIIRFRNEKFLDQIYFQYWQAMGFLVVYFIMPFTIFYFANYINVTVFFCFI